jgi:hypothetical protein
LISESRPSRIIYGPVKENGVWGPRYNHELYILYNEPDIMKAMKVVLLGWECRRRTFARS